MEMIVAKTVNGVFWILRRLFFSSKAGVAVHNFIFFAADRMCPVRFGRKIPDLPEVRKILRNGQWKIPSTTGFIRKTYLSASFRITENLTTWRSFVGYMRRQKLRKKGYIIPANIYLSPTYKCNLECKGCYARGHEGELSFDEIEKVVKEQERLGIFHILMFGGEPFLREDLWQVYANHPHTIFDVFTNGTLIGEREAERIAALGNIRLFVSLEGFKKNTDRRRGEGVYDKIINALKIYQQANIYFGVSVTVGKENFEEVTSEAFVEEMNGLGVYVISYILYMPCGGQNGVLSELTTDQVIRLERWGEYIQDHYPIFPAIGKNGSDLVTSCPAADGRIHITADGDVEPCMFCQFAADNIKGKSITEVMNSEFFQLIRTLNNAGISRFNPCKVEKSPLLQSYFAEAGAHPTIKIKGGT